MGKLDKYSIYELRILGRKIGVEKATSLKKARLIEEIDLILSNRKAPFVKKKEGRPAKEFRLDFEKDLNLNLVEPEPEMTERDAIIICIEKLEAIEATLAAIKQKLEIE